MLARLLMSEAASVSASSGTSEIRPDRIEQEFGRLESGEYAAWLLSQPEPTPDQLSEIIELCKSALPNLRRRFQRSAKLGPRHRRGGRPVELPDPELRKSIRETIKRLREPGTSLESLYKRLARKYGVSASTIKRIWAEGKRPDDGT